jgi:SPP1 gp7 family putative phage head morphogenesis protein
MRTLRPLTLREKYYAAIEAEINRILKAIIYQPLVDILGNGMRELTREIKNSASYLLDAIAEGIIWYEDGQFMGDFNARTSVELRRIGAIFNPKARTWSLPEAQVPTDVKFAQTQANFRYESMRASMLSALDNMDPARIDEISKTREEYEKSVAHMEGDLQATIPKKIGPVTDNPVFSRVAIEAKLTEGQKRIIARDWGQNLDLYIKKWTQENILKLREQIQPHVMAGGRAEGLVKVIQDNYGVSQRKAKFLARQETALLMSKFQETRYQDIGIQKYRWSTAHDARVRHDHHDLNGKVFRFDSPPVSNKKTGARNNPGQDFNCRCVAIPLVE